MNREPGNFRSNFFGGFNRHDVIEYIKIIIAERDKYKNDNRKLSAYIEKLEMRREETADNNDDNSDNIDNIDNSDYSDYSEE